MEICGHEPHSAQSTTGIEQQVTQLHLRFQVMLLDYMEQTTTIK